MNDRVIKFLYHKFNEQGLTKHIKVHDVNGIHILQIIESNYQYLVVIKPTSISMIDISNIDKFRQENNLNNEDCFLISKEITIQAIGLLKEFKLRAYNYLILNGIFFINYVGGYNHEVFDKCDFIVEFLEWENFI